MKLKRIFVVLFSIAMLSATLIGLSACAPNINTEDYYKLTFSIVGGKLPDEDEARASSSEVVCSGFDDIVGFGKAVKKDRPFYLILYFGDKNLAIAGNPEHYYDVSTAVVSANGTEIQRESGTGVNQLMYIINPTGDLDIGIIMPFRLKEVAVSLETGDGRLSTDSFKIDSYAYFADIDANSFWKYKVIANSNKIAVNVGQRYVQVGFLILATQLQDGYSAVYGSIRIQYNGQEIAYTSDVSDFKNNPTAPKYHFNQALRIVDIDLGLPTVWLIYSLNLDLGENYDGNGTITVIMPELFITE
jgi:hypothetical protein